VKRIHHRNSPALLIVLLAGWLSLETTGPARAQLTTSEEERLQILTDPDALRKKLEEKRNRPPFEFFRSQVAPFDILPYVKVNHWSTLTFELVANEDNYDGVLQTEAVKLANMPHEVYFRRDGLLIKEQRAKRALQFMIPDVESAQVRKQFMVDLLRPGALRADASWPANLSTLPPHQMLVLILSKESTTKFAAWNRMSAMLPGSVERDGGDLEKVRYYRLVLPIGPDPPPLSSHPLTWTTTSHVVWDNYPPDELTVYQQQAMLDWLHWGGQIILCGGAGQSFSVLRDSFLGPYLPGEATGATVPLSEDDLRPLSQSYPPPHYASSVDNQSEPVSVDRRGALRRAPRVYRAPVPIRPGPKRPVHLAVLKPKEGASTISLGEASPHVLAVERRVGRGRITMLAANPNEEAMLAWPGIDTLIRRVILRRPEETLGEWNGPEGAIPNSPARSRLLSQELSWYRITSRDLVIKGIDQLPPKEKTKRAVEPADAAAAAAAVTVGESDLHEFPAVADWRDTASLPRLSRDLLEEASGITIPSSHFVLRVILAYLIAVVPLNWLICRFVLKKREWTWVVVPLVALAFAIGVERVAAHDMGYDTAADEIDLLELQGDYHRAHLTRLVSLYTNGRSHFAVSYPSDPTALALPLDNGRSIRGEDIAKSWWQSSPVPALLNFTVQPRSLAMFRAEEMLSLNGTVRLAETEGKRLVENASGVELRDAVLIESIGAGKREERLLGTIKPGASVEIGPKSAGARPARVNAGAGPDPNPFLEALRSSWDDREENRGELRLVAWASSTLPGQVIEPAIDRKRGFTAVLVHLRSGPPPSPDGRRYNLMASGNTAGDAASAKQIAGGRPAFRPSGETARRMSPRVQSTGTVAPPKRTPGR
jgi:hypothetical protein